MRKKVLIVTCEMLPYPGKPVCGGGIRVWGLGQGLSQAGHEVIYSLPADLIQEDDSLPDSIKANAHEPEKINERILSVMPDLVILEQWGMATYLGDLKIPVALDLHGPLSLENAFKSGGNFLSDALTKVDALAKADFLICPGELQKRYFYTWFLMAGADPTDAEIVVVPVGMSEKLPKKTKPKAPKLVFGGVTWPWIDPFPGLGIAAQIVDKTAKATFDLYIQKPPLSDTHPLQNINRNILKSYDEEVAGKKGVKLKNFIPNDKLIKQYTAATAAFDIYQRNPERELAVTTRTVEYMWAGLPVIYADFAELAGPIKEYDAGWIVDPNDEKAIRDAVTEAVSDPEAAYKKGENAQRLVSEKYTWKDTVSDLLPFVEKPPVRKREGTLVSGFRDYYRAESVEEILEGKNKLADLNDEIRALMMSADKEKRDRDRRIEELGEQVREVIFEKDKQVRELLSDHKKELEKKDNDVKRLQEKLDYETRTRDKEIQRLHTDRQLKEGKLQDEIVRLNQEKENDRQKAQAEIQRINDKRTEETAEIKKAKDDAAERHLAEVKKLHEQATIDSKAHADQIKKLNDEIAALREKSAEELKKTVEEKDKAFLEQKDRHEKDTEKLQTRIDKLTEQLEGAKKELGDEINSLNKQRLALKEAADAELKKTIEEKDKAQTEQKALHESQVDRLQTRIDKLTEDLEGAKKELGDEINSLNKEKLAVKEAADAELKKTVEEKDKAQTKQKALHEAQVDRLQVRIDKLTEELEGAKKELGDEIKSLNNEKEETRKKHEEQVKVLTLKHEQVLAKKDEQQSKKITQYDKKLDDQSQRRKTIETELQSEIRQLNRERQEIVARHDKALADANARFEDKLSKQAKDHEKQIAQLQKKIEKEADRRTALETELQAEIRRLNLDRQELISKHDQTLSAANSRFEEKLSKQATEHEKQVDKLQDRIDKEAEKRSKVESDLQAEIKILNRQRQDMVAKQDQTLASASTNYEDKLTKLNKDYEKQIKKLQDRIEKQAEKSTENERDLQADIRRLNKEHQAVIEKHDLKIAELTEKHQEQMSKARSGLEDEIKELNRKQTRQTEKYEDELKQLRDDLKRISILREEEGRKAGDRMEKAQERHEQELLLAAKNAALEIERKEKELLAHNEKIAEVEKQWQLKLDAKDADIDTLRGQLDELNQQITSRLTELDRVAAEKEIFIREAKKRFDMLEGTITDQRKQISRQKDELSSATVALEQSDSNAKALADSLDDLKTNFEKVNTHAAQLEGELPSLRRRAELAERELADFTARSNVKQRTRKIKQRNKYLSQLPKLGFLWGVNLVTNSYMELWQKRVGHRLFPGTKKAKSAKVKKAKKNNGGGK